MKSLLSCVVAVSVFASANAFAARTAPDLTLSQLTISAISENSYDPVSGPILSVLSETAGSTQLAFSALGQNGFVFNGGHGAVPFEYSLDMLLRPTAGHRITGISFAATLTGTLKPAQVPAGGTPGYANNRSLTSIAVGGKTPSFTLETLAGSQVLTLDAEVSSTRDLSLQFSHLMSAFAEYGRYDVQGSDGSWYEVKKPSYADISISAPVLTIHTALAPVPEPGTYAMLLAGLAVAGVAARRRNKTA